MLFIVYCLLFIALFSCSLEEHVENNILESNLTNEISFDVKNNNLILNTSESLVNLYNNLKDGKKSDLELIKSYYSKGFYPMELVSIASDEQVKEYFKKKSSAYLLQKNNQNSNLNNPNIINNDNFASILSEDGEIQVADSIYKYTRQGLLITHVDKRDLLQSESLSKISSAKTINNDVELYIPNRNNILDFDIDTVSDCNENPIISQEEEHQFIEYYYGCDGGGSTGVSSNGSLIPDTSNYNECLNSKAGWIDNIFGKSYVCEYFFNSDKKLRTIFEAADFYFFQDVYAQAKFKNKTWLGWYSDRGADQVYLLNKKVILNTITKNRQIGFSSDWKSITEIFNEIHAFFLTKPDTSIIYVSNEYDFKTKVITNHISDPNNLVSLASNSLNLVIPPSKITTPLIDIDFDLKNFFGKKIDKAITVNVMSLEYKLSNTDIIKLSFEALSGKKIKLDDGETGAIVFIYTDPKTMESKPVAYSIFGEKITVKNLAVAKRDFDLPQHFRLDEFSLIYKWNSDHTSNNTKENVGLGFKFRIDIVNSVDVELESGAYYGGKWGGSKFRVKY